MREWPVLHSEILPEQDCGGELIELSEDEPVRPLRPVCSLWDGIYLRA
jgi:hypothetical protein